MKLSKRIVALGAVIIMGINSIGTTAYAANDPTAAVYGFTVDTSQYKNTVWYNTVTTNVKSGGDIIGVSTTKIGMTRLKTKSGGKYLDQVFVKCTMKGKQPKHNKAGYSESLTIRSQLPTHAELAGYSPEPKSGMSSYSIGVGSSGISGSTTVTKNALEINNRSNTATGYVNICYDYDNNWWLPWNYNTYGKYAYNESIQRMQYAIETTSSKYKLSLVVTPEFEEKDGTDWLALTNNKFGSVKQTINFTTPY